jgi:hypothetical protein
MSILTLECGPQVEYANEKPEVLSLKSYSKNIFTALYTYYSNLKHENIWLF